MICFKFLVRLASSINYQSIIKLREYCFHLQMNRPLLEANEQLKDGRGSYTFRAANFLTIALVDFMLKLFGYASGHKHKYE